jgi:hypothetical protein
VADRRPWLEGLIAVTSRLHAETVRAELKKRGMTVRTIPSGAAGHAWNGVGPGGRTVAVILTPPGVFRTRSAAGFWAPQAQRLASLGSSAGTGSVSPPALLLDGDPNLAARARTALRPQDPPVVAGQVGSIDLEVTSQEALASLAAAGFAAVDGSTATWREAGERLGAPVLAVHAVRADPELPERLQRLEPPGSTGRNRWRTALALIRHPGDRAPLLAADAARRAVADVGARCAVAACLGPH